MKIKGTPLKKGRTEPVMRMYPNYQFHVSDHIVFTGDKMAIATLAIEGTPFESISDATLENDFNAIKTFLVNLGKDGDVYLWTNLVKELIALDQEYHFENKFLRQFVKKYVNEFKGTSFYKATYYITFGVKYTNIYSAVEQLNEIIQQSLSALGKYGAHVLSVNADDGVSDVADYLHLLLNKQHARIPLSINPLSSSIADSEFYFGYDTLELRNNEAEEKKFATNYVLKDFPQWTITGQWDFLLKMPYEFIITQSFIYESPTRTLKAIDSQLNKLVSVGDAADTQQQELMLGKEVVASGVTLFGSYHCALTVFGKTAGDARANGIKVSGEFIGAGKGFKFSRVNSAGPHVYFSHLPMNKVRPLATRRTITNLACTFSLHNYSHGKKLGNPIGDGTAIMPLKTVADGLYWFNTHYSKPGRNVRGQKIAGHAMILGATGAGKTTLEGVAAGFVQRFEPYMFVVDYNRSTELFVRAYGGAYFALREGEYTGLNPFQLCDLDDELAPRLTQFLKSYVNTLAYDQSGKPCTDAQAKELAKAVDATMALPRKMRRLSSLLSRVSDIELKTRFSKWVGNGQYAWAVDSPENTFNPMDYKKVGFDTTVILEKTKDGVHPACEPLLAILFFYKSLMQRSGKLMLSIIEEFWMPANFPLTQAMIKSSLKAGRMKGEMMWLTSQSPEDAIECEIFAALVQQTPTKILLPNPDADFKGYEKIGLTLKEFEKLRLLTLESRTMLIKQSGSSCFAKMDLYGFDDFLPIISGSMEGIAICEQIRHELKTDDPDIWIPELLKRLKEL